jgi:hypothetical protein
VEASQLAWTLYIIGGLGCGLAAWFLFRRLGREWAQIAALSVWVLLLTPYALDAETMTMAPAVFILIMDGLTNGFDAVKPIGVLLLGLWLVCLIISLLLQLLARGLRKSKVSPAVTPSRRTARADLDKEEMIARDELLHHEIPLRAER